jgi:hypothetical protein
MINIELTLDHLLDDFEGSFDETGTLADQWQQFITSTIKNKSKFMIFCCKK